MKDYYKTLGVERSATKDDIKKAFRKLAHEHHPDKTKNDPTSSQKFKEASEAYSVLSDDAKRKQYDTFGSAGPGFNPGAGGFGGGFGGGQGFGGFDFSGFQNGQGGVEFDLGDIFGDIFGGGRGRQTRQERGRDIYIDIEITFEESIFGVERDILVTKAAQCLTCNGNGAEPGSGVDTCKTCDGHGKVNEARRTMMGVFSTSRVCSACRGKGRIPRKPCHACHGEGILEREQELSVKIPAGMDNGEMVRLSGMGEAIANGPSGDLYVKTHVIPHSKMRRQGMDIVMDLKVKLTQSLLGDTMSINTLDGALDLVIPEGVNTGEILRIKGRGVPNERGKRGDLLISITVDMPKKLPRSLRDAVEQMKKIGL